MITSTVRALVVTPVVYSLVADSQGLFSRVFAWIGNKAHLPQPAAIAEPQSAGALRVESSHDSASESHAPRELEVSASGQVRLAHATES